ncbi:transposase [Chryseobacterium elymi]|uniref:Transposase n=1 Tax=Chryseobacterium elymi TaxID=395936 RepID=A0A3D9DPX8_9FLAO|nr:transposase [Chryseobacterium elymi]REC80085.1 transposase [Chryseobacterium elymi]
MNFKNIHIGQKLIERVAESGVETSRICNFLKCSVEETEEMYKAKSLDSEILLKWSKLLKYDFFRLYSQHLIFYAPQTTADDKIKVKKSSLPKFRKNIYTKEVIDFMIEQIESNKMTKDEVVIKYRIPKTTLHKWISKYRS